MSGVIPGPLTQGVGASGVNASTGALRVRNKEFWKSLAVTAAGGITTINFVPGKSGMTVLDGVGAVYDNYRVLSARVYIVGTSPTNSSTIANICLDYDPANSPTNQDGVLRAVPNVTVPGYRNGLLVANRTSMNRRNWFVSNLTAAEDTCVFNLTAWTIGAATETFLVYCDYDVEFRNPCKT